MLTTTLTAIASLQMIFFSKNDESLWTFVVILWVQFFLKHSPLSKRYPKVRRSSFVPMELASFPFSTPSPTERIQHTWPNLPKELFMKRDDLIHPIVSGNKWRKLKGFFASHDGVGVLTFGGAHSNHLRATAFALHHANIPGIAVVRGNELHPASSPTLEFCQSKGLKLVFVRRSEYRALREANWQPTPAQKQLWGASRMRILPEGGAGAWTQLGCAEIWQEIAAEFIPHHFVLASGTAATVQGILRAMDPGAETKVHVVSAVKGARREELATRALAEQKGIDLHWEDEVHFGGFGKSTAPLQQLVGRFEMDTGFAIDPIYNAKVLNYLNNQMLKGSVIWLNTGGVFK